MAVFSFPAITLNIGADIQGMGAVANLLVPIIPTFAFSILFTGLLIYFIIKFSYQQKMVKCSRFNNSAFDEYSCSCFDLFFVQMNNFHI